MTALGPHTGSVVRATPSELTAVFWDGCARGELLYQCCNGCGAPNFDPVEHCRVCLSTDLSWERSDGRGTIATWTLVWRPVEPSYEVPYAVAVIDLDEGYQMVTNIVGCDHTDVHSGMRVAVAFHPDADGFVLPYFRPRP